MGKQHIRFEEAVDASAEEIVPVVKINKKHKQEHNFETTHKETDGAKWYHEFAAYTHTETEITPLKEKDVQELANICQKAFEGEQHIWRKKDPQDARWLQTVLHKGTLKDRVNSGALLVLCNPLANLKTLSTLTSSAKPLNSTFTEILDILSNMWKKGLLPPERKLKSLPARGNDWHKLKQNNDLTKEQKQTIYGQWHFEHELKEIYGEFLRSLQQCLQQAQEHSKRAAISCCAELLINSPEKESMLLSLLVNKLGDPLPKVASKALHSLTDVARRHPNMCLVIVQETEKLLFRNNVTERAVHFGLCLLATLTGLTIDAVVCNKMMHICFALFNLLVQRGNINNRTMLAILRCLQRAIVHAAPAEVGKDILNKDLQDTIYRLAHNAELHIAVQTFGLLLQLISSPLLDARQKDRFYNALYQKLCELQLVNVGARVASQLLHIVHRAMHLDTQRSRVQAYVKRLLQLALYVPPHMASAIIIVLHKLQRTRRDLFATLFAIQTCSNSDNKQHLHKEEHDEVKKVAYDPYYRVPAFCGVEHTACHELLYFSHHFHPTVQVLAESVQNKTKLSYFGDPLQDFSLTHFLDRFVFKNPKKEAKSNMNTTVRAYKPTGARGLPLSALKASTCTEDEAYILNFMEKERHKREKAKNKDEDEDDEQVKTDVDDNEFDDYLDGFFGKKSKKAMEKEAANASEDEEEDETFEFLKALEGTVGKKSKNKKDQGSDDEDENEDESVEAHVSEDELDSIAGDEADEDDSEIDDEIEADYNDDDDDDDDNDDDDEEDESDEELQLERKLNSKPKLGKRGIPSTEKSRAKKRKEMSSLFAAADDFSMMLEEAAEIKGQGTSNAVNTKGKKLSEKQLQWEQKRTFAKPKQKKNHRK